MIREELIKRSPLRIFEKSIHGGLGKGKIGVIAACKGVGKTACLVHIATDQLFQGKYIIHISFAPDTNHIVSWYEDIFQELSSRYKLDNAMDIHNEIVKHRIILNFKQEGVSILQIRQAIISIVKDAKFNADTIIIDGFDFSKVTPEEFTIFKELAEEISLEIWFSATLNGSPIKPNGIPELLEKFINSIAVLIILETKNGFVHLNLVKDHERMVNEELHLRLDPRILLIAEEN
ncbi:MAG: hypothetical protein N2053_07375 [Chitinispirillaceae bacterium]|nr:hypothetical protein [Chitinispirillaceae bacterium]